MPKDYSPENILIEVIDHYKKWNEDNDKRLTRKHGWNDITDAYYGKLPDDFPFINRVTDPKIKTVLIEKNARVINSKLRGRLVPREGGDVIGARINNALLEYQWDNANYGGSMLLKWGMMDIDTRLYGTKFGLCHWRYDVNKDKKVNFEGNEFEPLDIRDCGMDFAASHIRDAKWFQNRAWEYLEDLEEARDSQTGEKIYKNLDKLMNKIRDKHYRKSDKKENEYTSRVKTIKGLTDRVGDDLSFPIVEVVTEYREDKWITFAPQYNEILRIIDNPYRHGKIPIVQNRYYTIQDDNLGESEIEPVLPLFYAIQATVCGYLDEVAIKMRPPLKVIESAVRMDSIEYGPENLWLVDNQDAIQEMQSQSTVIQYFQTTYSVLVSAFNQALGEMSQGTSTVSPFENDKTATEVKATIAQQQVRDQKNQNDLGECIKDMMMMWHSNNQQFLFADKGKHEHILRIVGKAQFEYLAKAGLDSMDLSPEAMTMIADVISQMGGEVNDYELKGMVQAGETPRFPVIENPREKNPELIRVKPKMRVNDIGDSAELSLVPEDVEGNYDYVPDVKSMALGASDLLIQGRQRAIDTIIGNPNVIQLLQQQQVTPNLKEMLISNFEDLGFKDAERFFQESQAQQDHGVLQGAPANQPNAGIPAAPEALPPEQVEQQLAGPSQF